MQNYFEFTERRTKEKKSRDYFFEYEIMNYSEFKVLGPNFEISRNLNNYDDDVKISIDRF